MSGSTKIPIIAGIAGTGASLAALAASPAARSFITQNIGFSVSPGTWKYVALVLAVLNIKNLPFVWHYRIFRGLVYHLYLQPRTLPASALFQPIIISTRTPFTECDYNMHKSNATYFTDLDEARTHLVMALLRKGIRRLGQQQPEQPTEPVPAPAPHTDSFNIALGGISCFFRKEIAPYEKVEIWSRVLSWDRKWLYVVSHFVRAGVVKPKSYTLQPWKRGALVSGGKDMADLTEEEKEKIRGAVIATSLARYVVKKGRLTIPVEQVLRRSDLLPPRPAGEMNGFVPNGAPKEMNGAVSHEDVVFPPEISGDWTWEKVEEQRVKGLKFAERFGELEGLHDIFDGGVEGAIGRF